MNNSENPIRAVIDLGTNTFHLLVVETGEQGQMKEVYRERIFVRLAEDDINRISDQAMQRGLNAMMHFKEVLNAYPISSYKAFGTAALRTAVNGRTFIQTIFEKTGIPVKLIDGLEEARLIHLGVRQAVPFNTASQLIMDIGGGSVEFVIANQSGVLWAHSFLIGVGILFARFHKSDPLSEKEEKELMAFLHENLHPLKNALQQYPCQILTGASGAFETVLDLMPHTQHNNNFSTLDLPFFEAMYQKITKSTVADRMAMPQIPEERIEMIVVSMVLIKVILEIGSIEEVYVSGYAMKEGMLLG